MTVESRWMEVGGRRCRVFCAGPRPSVSGDVGEGGGCPLLVQLVSERQEEDLEREAEMIFSGLDQLNTYHLTHNTVFVAVPVRDWELELMPWAEPAVSKRPEVGTGAGETLRYLMEALLPAVLPPPPAGTPPYEGGEPVRSTKIPSCKFCAAPRCEGEEPVRATKVPSCELYAAPRCEGEEPVRATKVPSCELYAAPRCEGEEPVRATKVPSCELYAAPRCEGEEPVRAAKVPSCELYAAPPCEGGEPVRATKVPACEFYAAPRCEWEESVRATKVPSCEFYAAPLDKGSCRAATEGFAPIILGGYSLAGLFALWAACQTDRFGAVVAGSPSLWAGDWPGYAAGHAMQARQVYLSLGDREERSRNKTFARVGDRIREEHRRLQQQLGEENTTLVWEEGGHFADPAARMARGFVWCLSLKIRI